MSRGRSSSGLASDGNASTTSSDNSGPNNTVGNSSSFATGAGAGGGVGGGGGGGGTTARLGNKLGINKLKNRIKLKRIGGIKNIEIQRSFDSVSIAEETMIAEDDDVVPLQLHENDNDGVDDDIITATDGGKQQGDGGSDNDTDGSNHSEIKLPCTDLDKVALNTSNDSGYGEFVSSVQGKSNDNIMMNAPANETCDSSERDPRKDVVVGMQLEVLKSGESSAQALPAKKSSNETTLPTTRSDSEHLGQEVPPIASPVKLTTTGAPNFTILDVSMDDSDMDVYENEDERNCDDDDDDDDGDDTIDNLDYNKYEMFSPHAHTQTHHYDRKQPQSLAPRDATSSFEVSTQSVIPSTSHSPLSLGVNHFKFDVSMDTSIADDDFVLDDADDDEHNIVNDKDDNFIVETGEPLRPRRSPRESYDDISVKQTKRNHPSSTKSSLSCLRTQASNITSPTSVFHQEYNVDHSCSTPLERLARDIGNTLRQWHVHQGCDWHVPLDWADQMEDRENFQEDDAGEEEVEDETSDQISDVGDGDNDDPIQEVSMTMSDTPSATTTTTTCMSMDLCMNGFRNRTRTINLWMGDESAMVPSGISLQTKSLSAKLPPPLPPSSPLPPKSETKELSTPPKTSKISLPSAKKVSRERCHRGAQCIRSKKIQFQTIGVSPETVDGTVTWSRRRYCIPLLLKLWDAPQFPVDETKIDGRDGMNSFPRSLQPCISPSLFSLLGKFGFLSPCGTERQFYNPSSQSDSTNTVDAGVTDARPTSGLTQDLSSLFNIGQHITLSIDLSEIIPTSQNDIETLYNDIRSFIEHNVHEAVEAQRERQCIRKQQHRHLRRQRHHANDDNEMSVNESDNLKGDILHQDGQAVAGHSDDEDASSNYYSSESDDSYTDETINNDLDLDQQEMHAEVIASLTGMLQTALNLAASENDCRIPVFGIWGDYYEDSGGKANSRKSHDNGAPSWISSSLEYNLLQIGDRSIAKPDESEVDHAQTILLSSPVLSGKCLSETCQSSHQLYYVPRQALPVHLSTLNGLANVFISQCPSIGGTVVLAAARHSYHWAQQTNNDICGYTSSTKGKADWRNVGLSNDSSSSEIEVYREQCRKHALLILERSFSPSTNRVPIWGPNDGNPLLSLSAIVSWGVIHRQDINSSNAPPLMQLPLKIRSSNFASTPSELFDLELALQSSALNPIGSDIVEKENGHHEFGPREPTFLACAEFDADAPCATLSANTRCVLAALLRCGSLAQDVLPGHLTKRGVVANFGKEAASDIAEGEISNGQDMTNTETILRKAMDLANVGSVTKRLVDALDWGDLEMNLSAADFDRAISEALQRIHSTTYPSPPAGVFALGDVSNKVHLLFEQSRSKGKGSPPGRLLSILFAHMARLRTPTSMMRLWLSFVEELRTRWDHNESLPNLSFVPGLDNYGDSQLDKPHWGLQKADTRVLGHRADHAAFVNSSEPDPDRDHCIINQKLQVYNICIECKMSTEALHHKIADRHNKVDSMNSDGSSSDMDDEEFFDPDEEGVTFEKSFDSNDGNNIERLLMIQAAVTNPSHNRPGARCPVPDGMPLIKSGDQLYAPYLQRTMPMTDEEEENQKKFLGVSKRTRKEDRTSISSRLKIAQRLQKPKLLSDMSSFKAANHGAIFEDFVRWYGNPENPLSEEFNGETARRALEYRSKLPTDEAKALALEEASEAIAILMSLRAFWEDTWEEAAPVPAFDQEPLFNPYATVEMVLHSFETIHPALLVNQVMSVKLTNAKFVLESAANPGRKIRSVAQSLVKLQTSIDAALEMLTKDAASGFLQLAPESLSEDSSPLAYVSTSTIIKCEDVCNVIGELELLLSRALPLLQILPGEYGLVDTLLQCEEERYHILRIARERSAFLRAIKRHQTNCSDSPSEAIPVMREYVLRNPDPANPCQLSARLVPSFEKNLIASLFHGSLLMAITKSSPS